MKVIHQKTVVGGDTLDKLFSIYIYDEFIQDISVIVSAQ